MYLDDNWRELIEFIEHVSVLDNDESSPVHYFNNHVARGNYVVLRDDVLAAFAYAESVLASYFAEATKDRKDHDHVSASYLAELQAMLTCIASICCRQINRYQCG